MTALENFLYSVVVLVSVLGIYFLPRLETACMRLAALLLGVLFQRHPHPKRITPPPSPMPGKASSLEVAKESKFGAQWYSSPHIFAIERRALFSTRWLYATHRNRFSKAGDYLTLSIAGFSFFLILGKDNVLRGFHNVCRHRAYEVTRKECGSSLVLGCRYHGWSYDTTGSLVKAPEFENLMGFDKRKNSLFEIYTQVDGNGFVFVNLDAGEAEDFEGVKLENVRGWKLNDSVKIGEWQSEGKFNWKLAGGFNKQCGGTPTSFLSMIYPSWFQSKRPVNIQISITASVTWYPSERMWVSTRILPSSASRTIVAYEAYMSGSRKPKMEAQLLQRLKEISETNMHQLEASQIQLVSEDVTLSEHEYTYQDVIHSTLKVHLKLERLSGGEIHPAARQATLSAGGKEDDDLCQELEISAAKAAAFDGGSFTKATEGLDW